MEVGDLVTPNSAYKECLTPTMQELIGQTLVVTKKVNRNTVEANTMIPNKRYDWYTWLTSWLLPIESETEADFDIQESEFLKLFK